MKTITTRDVANEAQVSLATVDRVINKRPGVKPATAERINQVIKKLGYVRDLSAANLAKKRTYKIRFILPDSDNPFMDQLKAEIEGIRALEMQQKTLIEITTVPALSVKALSSALLQAAREKLDGVVFVAIDNDEIKQTVNKVANSQTIPITIVSDIPSAPRAHFVGINNEAAGRTAASLLGRFLPCRQDLPQAHLPQKQKIALVGGSMSLMDHMQRRHGFEQVIAEDYPHLEILPMLEGHDNNQLTEQLVDELLERHPDISGLYNLGAANEAVVKSLQKHQAKHNNKIYAIGHDLLPATRRALIDGTFDAVINQDPAHQVRSAVRVARTLVDKRPILASKERIRIDIYLKDNLPDSGT